MRDILVTAIILGSIPFIFRRPWIGVLMWTWVGMMSPHRLTWGFAYNQPFALVIGLVTIVAILFSREPKRFPFMPATVTLLLFSVWMTVTTIFALYPDDAWRQWYKVITIQFFVVVTIMLMQNPQRIRWLIWVTTASLGFYGVKGGIYTLRGGGSGMVLGPEGSFIAGNTEIALAITMIIPLMYYLAMTTEKKWLKWGLGIGMVLCAIAVLGSQSRGGLLAVAGMGVFLWLKSRKKLQMGLIFIVLVPALLALMPETWFNKMHTINTYEENSSAMGRINAWHFSFNLAKSRPIVGGGFQAFTPELFQILAPNPDDFHDSHSIWFEVLGQHGFVGLALFLLLWFLVWRLAAGIIRTGGKRKEMRWATELARMIQVSFIGYWVGGSFLGLAYFDLPYLLVALLVLTRVVMDRQLAKETQQAGPSKANIARIRAVGTIGTTEFMASPAITQNPKHDGWE